MTGTHTGPDGCLIPAFTLVKQVCAILCQTSRLLQWVCDCKETTSPVIEWRSKLRFLLLVEGSN
mgnify:CR=1 FL=1